MNTADTNYDRTKPWREQPLQVDDGTYPAQAQPGPRYDYMGPFSSKQDELISRALLANTIPGVQLADIVRPPIPMIDPFRSRYGYRTRQIGIADLMNVDELYTEPPVRYDAADQGWEGTLRNAQGGGFW